jgi:hypothetical protein
MAVTLFPAAHRPGAIAISLILAGLTAGAPAAFAQRPPAPIADADTDAQRLFQQGVDAARLNQWEEARRDFEEAYRLAPRLVVLINLASAQARTGLLVEALENYRRVASSTSAETAEFRNAANAVLPSLQERIPRVRVNPAGLGPSDIVEIDGQRIPATNLEKPQLVNPGQHTMTVTRQGVQRSRIVFSLSETETHDISLPAQLFVPLSPHQDGDTPIRFSTGAGPSDTAARRPWWKSPWFWGATVAVVAAATVSLVVFAERPEVYSGNVGSGVVNVP